MKVPFLDIKACFNPLREEIFNELGGVFDRCDFVLGKPVHDLEEAIRERLGTRFALGVANGTDALVIALRAAGIGPGDEVITSPFTFIATAESVWAAGGRPVFCDISPASYNLDPARVEEFLEKNCRQSRTRRGLINKRTGGIIKGILPVHLYGLMADMNAFLALGEKYGLKIIEDTAQAQGAKMTMRGGGEGLAAALGDAGTLSFYPSKNLGGAGDGGMIATNDEEIYDKANVLHIHGGRKRYYHDVFGYNSRLDSIQAAILLVKLKKLDEWLTMRRANGALYKKLFLEKGRAKGVEVIESSAILPSGAIPGKAIVIPSEPEGFFHTYNTFEIRLPNRDEVMKQLTEKEIGCGVYYPLPLHLQEVFSYLGMSKGDLPVTETICHDIMALPQYPELSPEAIEYVVDTVVGLVNH